MPSLQVSLRAERRMEKKLDLEGRCLAQRKSRKTEAITKEDPRIENPQKAGNTQELRKGE